MYVVLAIVLALVAAASAVAKLTEQETVMEGMRTVGAEGIVRWLALAELVGAVGLIVGIWVEPIASPLRLVWCSTSSSPSARTFASATATSSRRS